MSSNTVERHELESLQQALVRAKEALTKQGEIINRLTSRPFAYATVVQVGSVSPHTLLTKKGAQVRIRPDSQYAGDTDEIGTVVNPKHDHGWVKVKFPTYGAEAYRVGLADVDEGACDLELADGTSGKFAVISIENQLLEVNAPEINIEPGDTVKLNAETMQIVGVAAVSAAGDVAIVQNVHNKTFCEVSYQGSVRVVFNGKHGDKVEKGDRVILDATAIVVIRNLGKEDKRFAFTGKTNVSWESIGGLVDAKRELIEAVELPHQRADLYSFYGKRPPKGILLYGPPGCGKTLLAKATATAIQKIYGTQNCDSGYLYVKGPEILDKFVGETEAAIRRLFDQARQHQKQHGSPAVIFLDEADAVLGKRGSGISSDIERTIVPMFLAEMDGLHESGALVILATNRPDTLDSAVVRDGRIDRKIKVDRPTLESAIDIFQIHLANVPLNNGYTTRQIAEKASSELFGANRVLYKVERKGADPLDFKLCNLLNGAMIAGIVDQATSAAMRRDLSEKKPQGMKMDDVVTAVDTVFRQNLDTDHSDDLALFVEDFRDHVTAIRRVGRLASN